MASRRRSRSAFTLIEMLVVIAIIGALASLILPAVGAAREAARTTQCNARLGSLADATQAHVSNHNRYPGYVDTVGGNDVTWTVRLFNNLDETALYNEWRDGRPRVVYLEKLVCPADTAKASLEGGLSYVANAGRWNNGGMPAPVPAGSAGETPANGLFVNQSRLNPFGPRVTPADVVDGDSQTLAFTENLQATLWGHPAISYADKTNTTFVWHASLPTQPTWLINGDKTALFPPGALMLDPNYARPSSFHRGGVNVAFADGHTLFLSDKIDYLVLQALMTPNGTRSEMYRLNASGAPVTYNDASAVGPYFFNEADLQ